MSNEYYTPSGTPGFRAKINSQPLRTEYALLEAAFDKLPTLAGNGGRVVVINAGGTEMDVTSAIAISGNNVTLAGALAMAGALSGVTTLAASGNSTIGGTLGVTGVLTASAGLVGNVTGNLTGAVTGAASLNVLKAGDTMTGALNIGATVSALMALNGTNAAGVRSQWQTSGTSRGYVGAGSNMFTGAALSDFGIASEGALLFGGPGGAISGRFDTSGNLGVGTTPTATYKVDVAGTVRSTGGETTSGYGYRVLNATGNGGGHLTANAGVSGGVTLGADGGPIDYLAGGSTRWRMTTGGNLTPLVTGTLTVGASGAEVLNVIGRSLERISAGALTITASDAAGTLDFRVAGASAFSVAATRKTTFSAGVFTSTSSQAFTATPTFDANASNVFEFSGAMTANVTSMTISNASNGQTIQIRVKQDGTGGRTVAGPSGAKIAGSVSATAGTASILTLTYSAMDARWEGSWLNLPT